MTAVRSIISTVSERNDNPETTARRAIAAINYNSVIESAHELPLYHEVTTCVLAYLRENGPTSFGDIVANTQGSDRRVLRLLDQLVRKQFLAFENGTFALYDSKARGTRKQYRPAGIRGIDAVCPRCDGKAIPVDGALAPVLKRMRSIVARRPLPTFIFDQRPVSVETTVRRVGYLLWRGDLRGKRIALLGDDDLTSIAIAMTGLAKEVVVLEIDQRLTAFIRQIAKEEGLRIRVVNADLTKPLPKTLVGKFDVFLADPTPTRIPFTVFTNHGIALLKKGGRGTRSIGYLSFYSSAMRRAMELQEALTRMGLLMTDVVPFFTQYAFVPATYSEEDLHLLDRYAKGVSALSFYEHLVRVETTPSTKQDPIAFTVDDLLGTATQRVLRDPSKDPTMRDGSVKERRYLHHIMTHMHDDENKTGGLR